MNSSDEENFSEIKTKNRPILERYFDDIFDFLYEIKEESEEKGFYLFDRISILGFIDLYKGFKNYDDRRANYMEGLITDYSLEDHIFELFTKFIFFMKKINKEGNIFSDNYSLSYIDFINYIRSCTSHEICLN